MPESDTESGTVAVEESGAMEPVSTEDPQDAFRAGLIKEFLPVVESLRGLMSSFAQKMLEPALVLSKLRESFDYWERQVPIELKKVVGKTGLIVPVSQISLADLQHLLKLHRNGDEDGVISRVHEYYDDIFAKPAFLEKLASVWRDHPVTQRRGHLLCQALNAHDIGLFGASIPTLLAQFEGLVVDALPHQGKMMGAELRARLAELESREGLLGPMLTSFANEVLWEKFFHGDAMPKFSRHAVLHGGDINYATETNSRTAILLIDNFRLLLESSESVAT